MSLGDKNSLHDAISSFQEFFAARLHITYIVVVPFSIRSITESHDLPEQNTKTPHVTSRAERSMFKRLGCGPTNWNFTSLWGNQKKHDLMLRYEIQYLLRNVQEKQRKQETVTVRVSERLIQVNPTERQFKGHYSWQNQALYCYLVVSFSYVRNLCNRKSLKLLLNY